MADVTERGTRQDRIELDDEVDRSLSVPSEREEPGELEEPEPPQAADAGVQPRETHLREGEPGEIEEPPSSKPAKYNYRGEELTAEELINRGVLDKLITTEGKYAELQQKHKQLAEERKARQPEEPERPPPTQPELSAIYADEVARTVKNGYLTQDFVDAYPDEAVQMVMHRDLLYDARNRVEQLEGIIHQIWNQGRAQSWQVYIDQMLNNLADRKDPDLPEGFFGTLKEPEMRSAFIGHLKAVKPREDQLTGEKAQDFLADQFMIFNKEAFVEAMRIQRERGNGRPAQDKKRQATGEHAGARGASPETPANRPDRIELDDEVDALLGPQ